MKDSSREVERQDISLCWTDHLKNSPLAFIEWTPDLVVRQWSPQAEELFGWPADETEGKPLTALGIQPPGAEESLADLFSPMAAGKLSSNRFEQLHRTAEGDEIYCEWHNSAVSNGKKRPVSILSQISDITERKQSELQLRQSLHDKETLLEEIHHRVKNNLAVISGLLELQILTTDDDRIADTLHNSQSRIQSMAMVHEKLYRSPTLSRVRLDEYIKELAETILTTFSSKQKELTLDLSLEEVNIDIQTAIPLGLLLNELMVNSVKHAFAGLEKGTITARLREKGDCLGLTISDDGKGLPEGFRLEGATSMGMSLVQTLSKQLNASISYGSSRGAAFHIELPLSESGQGAR